VLFSLVGHYVSICHCKDNIVTIRKGENFGKLVLAC